jgi:protein-tyrosine phosphatase
LHLPCIDFTSPALEQIEKAVEFIENYTNRGHTVYSTPSFIVHCQCRFE